MNRSLSERRLKKFLKGAIPDVTPGVLVRAYHKGKLLADVKVGETFRYYDWASLTKVVFTATHLMKLFDQKKIGLDEPIRYQLPWVPWRFTSEELLSHTAGLQWWKPLYRQIDRDLNVAGRWDELQKLLLSESPHKSGKAVYSDLDLFYLAFLMERAAEKPLHNLWTDLNSRLELESAHFNVTNRPVCDRALYAPTERCAWRKKIIRGEVHDENCWALGGVATHAGLFGTMDDLSKWALGLRDAYLGKRWVASSHAVKKFTRRAIPAQVGDWGLGFMLPTKGRASCGKYFSANSFGHTGFTGTSFWFDPRQDLLVLILSNRIHPTRKNTQFLSLRPQIHDWVCELFMKD